MHRVKICFVIAMCGLTAWQPAVPAITLKTEIRATELTVIDDPIQAEQILAQFKGTTIELPKVRELKPAAVAVLARHNTDIVLNALEKLDADTAAAWKNFEHTLSLHGITKLDEPTAAALAECRAVLSLENLESLDQVNLATKLAAQPNLLTFRRLTAVARDVADELAMGNCDLAIPMIGKLDHAGLATKLLNGGQRPCYFEKLCVLGPQAAEALCSCKCDLYFKTLKQVDPAVAKAFEQHHGVLDLDKLQNVPPDVIASLLKNQGPLDLGGCNQLCRNGQPVPKTVLAALVAHAHSLTLGDLDAIPPDLVDAIRQRNHHTVLPDVRRVTVQLAAGLAGKGGVKGVVWLVNADQEPEEDAVNALLKLKLGPQAVLPGPLGSPAVILPSELHRHLTPEQILAIGKHVGIQFDNQFGP